MEYLNTIKKILFINLPLVEQEEWCLFTTDRSSWIFQFLKTNNLCEPYNFIYWLIIFIISVISLYCIICIFTYKFKEPPDVSQKLRQQQFRNASSIDLSQNNNLHENDIFNNNLRFRRTETFESNGFIKQTQTASEIFRVNGFYRHTRHFSSSDPELLKENKCSWWEQIPSHYRNNNLNNVNYGLEYDFNSLNTHNQDSSFTSNNIFKNNEEASDYNFEEPSDFLQQQRQPQFQNANQIYLNLLEKLNSNIKIMNEEAQDKRNIDFALNGRICDYGTKRIILISEITNINEIHENQTKVLLTTNNIDLNRKVICTITNFSNYKLELEFREKSYLTPSERKNGRFNANLYPNYNEIEFAKNGIEKIKNDGQMLEKLHVYGGLNNIKGYKTGPSIFDMLRATLPNIFRSAFFYSNEKILICAKKNEDVEKIAEDLFDHFPDETEKFVLLKTFNKNTSNPMPSKCIKTFNEVNDFSVFKIIICTIGVAPKLETKLFPKHFKNIFILNDASELECWMVIGNLAKPSTNIFISNCPNITFGQHQSIKYRTSMYERLQKLCDNPYRNSTVFEL